MKFLGEGWIGEEALAIALYCFLKNPKDYEKTVIMAANTNGDSDSNASITGAISGAYNGIRAIPEKWIKEVENSKLLRKTAEDLFYRWQKSEKQ
jgi:ADP-ribosylglycohydrolase